MAQLLTELRAIRAALEGQAPREQPRAVAGRLTVAQVAELNGVKEQVVLAWIKAGVLKAINVSAPGSQRPKWRITQAQLAEFDAARESRAKPGAARVKRRKNEEGAIEFFKK